MKTTECKNLKCQKRRSIMVMSARQIGHRLPILSRCAGRPNHTIAGISARYYYTFFSTLLLRDRELHYVMFRYPYTWCSRVFQSCLFHPWNFGPAFSGPAIYTHAIWSHVFQSRVFHSRVFSRSELSHGGKVTHSLRHVVPSVTHKLRTVQEMRDTQCHARALNIFVVTSRDILKKIFFEHFKIIATTWHALLHLTRIATHPHAHCHEFFPHWHAK